MQALHSTLRPDPEGKWILILPDGGTAFGGAAELMEMAATLGWTVVKEDPDA